MRCAARCAFSIVAFAFARDEIPLLATESHESDGRLAFPVKELDCGARRLVLEYGLRLRAHGATGPIDGHDLWEALQLGPQCADHPPSRSTDQPSLGRSVPAPTKAEHSSNAAAVHVGINGDDHEGNGSIAAPFRTLHRALEFIRHRPGPLARTIMLSGGLHFLGHNGTLMLSSEDSGVRIVGQSGHDVWLSGGIPFRSAEWVRVSHPSIPNHTIWKTIVRELLPGQAVHSLFTQKTHERMTLARYPNMNVETDQWGYSSRTRDSFSINSNQVEEWFKPSPSAVPEFTTIDLTDPHNPTGVVKNDSSMAGYNHYTEGHGGSCTSVWDGPTSYWCSNASAGGWAEVDAACAASGQPGIPIGMRWNQSLERLSRWADPRGAWVHAWHSQTWAMHMFEIARFDVKEREITFASGGGSQGGRNWCRCDQCKYAAGLWSNDGNWCNRGTHATGEDDRLIGGSWIVEGVFEELDRPGEFWYNMSSRELWVWPNTTDLSTPPSDLVIPVLETLVSIQGARDIEIENIGFRDTLSTYSRRWSVPSGGDWALHRSGAVILNGTENVSLRRCTFKRVDGNAVLLSGYNREARVLQSSFGWIGNTAIAAWGDTDGWDGRHGRQPRGTIVEQSLFHDVGLYQKQSSAWFQAKTAQTQLRNNIMFNMPRSAINFNDGFGGGNVVEGNLLFNTCRESGDHGPINSWDRQPYLTDVPHGTSRPSFDPAPTEIVRNYIWANYGAGQAVDNDDGSSFYWIHDNVFYDANGFKMDYGGHGSIFERNLVITAPYKPTAECINVGEFLDGMGDSFRENVCWLPRPALPSDHDVVGTVPQCSTKFIELRRNTYGTVRGNATLHCGGAVIPIIELYNRTGLEFGSKSSVLPSVPDMLQEMRSRLALPAAVWQSDAELYI